MGVLGINREAVEEHVLRRDDRGVPAGTKRVMEQPRVEWAQAEKARRSQRSRPGDLVLLRDTTAQHRGRIRKLDPQWTTPGVVSVSASGVSYTVRHHDPPSITKTFHLGDLVIYTARGASKALPNASHAISYSRDAFRDPLALVGQQAFYLDIERG